MELDGHTFKATVRCGQKMPHLMPPLLLYSVERSRTVMFHRATGSPLYSSLHIFSVLYSAMAFRTTTTIVQSECVCQVDHCGRGSFISLLTASVFHVRPCVSTHRTCSVR
jgi:hypothetical protein